MTTENNMVREVRKLPGLVQDSVADIDRHIRTLLTPHEIFAIKRIIMAGCGDSHMASVAAEMAFEQLAGIPAEPMTAMQAARYAFWDASQDFPKNPLVIGVSVSGNVVRTREALAIARQAGALTVAVTSNAESPLAKVSEKVLHVQAPESLWSPGVSSYCISMIALYLMAIRFAEVTGKSSQDQANQRRQEIKSAAKVIEQTIEMNIETAKAFAADCKEKQYFVFTGYGPNMATALFSAAKVMEAAGLHAIGQDTEEWAHLQYFVNADPETPTFLISPGGRGHNRAAELVEPMTRVGRKIAAVVPENDQQIAPQLKWVFKIPGNLPEWLTPMVYAVPAELFCSFLSEEIGEPYFRATTEAYQIGDNTIRSSKMMLAEDL